jgi:hypothetical protein
LIWKQLGATFEFRQFPPGGAPMLRKLLSRKLLSIVGLAGILISFGAVSTVNGDEGVQLPSGYRNWFGVNTMIVTKDSPLFAQIPGMHMIYVNAKGLSTLKNGGTFPYPDGTVFADEVHEILLKDGAYVEGGKKGVGVMVKDAKKYSETGGWGFQVFGAGDPSKPLLPDAAHVIQACFTCHSPQKAQDFTFSTYIP